MRDTKGQKLSGFSSNRFFLDFMRSEDGMVVNVFEPVNPTIPIQTNGVPVRAWLSGEEELVLEFSTGIFTL